MRTHPPIDSRACEDGSILQLINDELLARTLAIQILGREKFGSLEARANFGGKMHNSCHGYQLVEHKSKMHRALVWVHAGCTNPAENGVQVMIAVGPAFCIAHRALLQTRDTANKVHARILRDQ